MKLDIGGKCWKWVGMWLYFVLATGSNFCIIQYFNFSKNFCYPHYYKILKKMSMYINVFSKTTYHICYIVSTLISPLSVCLFVCSSNSREPLGEFKSSSHSTRALRWNGFSWTEPELQHKNQVQRRVSGAVMMIYYHFGELGPMELKLSKKILHITFTFA